MKKSAKPVAGTDADALELPDWRGMDDASARITPEAAFRLCESYPRLLSNARRGKPIKRPQKCTVEFIL